ncbi:MAG: pyruvate dehydrogenase (acetyl-transferring), homodimeric type, partial [Cyclobacteriaceae bacterium]
MASNVPSSVYEIENKEWIESLQYIIKHESPERVKEILTQLHQTAFEHGISFSETLNTPYLNSIDVNDQAEYPGDIEIERKLKSIIRWNAMAMVVRGNREFPGIGGHISTYASTATLFEVGFNHFWKGGKPEKKDLVYFQGHASPGVYARSFVEGQLDEENLEHFRREAFSEAGLSSYPHPRLMPDYWSCPTVSMGLSPIQAIYQARFIKYMEDRDLIEKNDQRKVWVMLGDGEMDEPESLGALTVAAREQLNNLIFVINCNLQRLDGPVRGNGKIIQELEAIFRGAGWKVIKVLWGSEWDDLLARDTQGLLKKRLEEIVDGDSQKYSVADGKYVREHLFGKYPELAEMVEHFSDKQLNKMKRGGHDPVKIYNAYKLATESHERPTVILAQTVKGYGLGEAGEGRNVTHQQKKLNEEELIYFRDRFQIPIDDEQLEKAPYYRPAKDSEEMQYLVEKRKSLGGFIPKRNYKSKAISMPEDKLWQEFLTSSEDREVATTMVIVHMLGKLLKDKNIGKQIVPIVPDES